MGECCIISVEDDTRSFSIMVGFGKRCTFAVDSMAFESGQRYYFGTGR